MEQKNKCAMCSRESEDVKPRPGYSGMNMCDSCIRDLRTYGAD